VRADPRVGTSSVRDEIVVFWIVRDSVCAECGEFFAWRGNGRSVSDAPISITWCFLSVEMPRSQAAWRETKRALALPHRWRSALIRGSVTDHDWDNCWAVLPQDVT